MTLSLRTLQEMSLAELEALWVEDRALEAPRGCYRGHVLTRIDNASSRRWRWSQRLAFERTPFGIDFDRRLWWFFTPAIAAGRFEMKPRRSRWRATHAFGLHYETSRLPRPIKGKLYDEIKLLPNCVLGMGGINAETGHGDHFWFVLQPCT